VLAAGLLTVSMRLPRRGSDTQILALAIGASLLATPIVQLHYFALLIVPLAVAFPRLCWAWALPLSMWVAAAGTPAPWQLAASLAITGLMLLVLTKPDAVGDALARVRGKAPARASGHGLDLRLAPPTTSSVAVRDSAR